MRKTSFTFMASAAEIRAKLYVMVAIKARSRRPPTVSTGMDRRKRRHSAAGKNRRRPAANSVLRTAHGGGRRRRYHLADGQPVEEPPDPGQLLLDRRARRLAHACLQPHGDVDRLDVDDVVDSVFRKPVEQPVCCACVSLAGVRVPDLRGEEVQPRAPASGSGVRDLVRNENTCGGGK